MTAPKKPDDGHATNRLADETSPYLQQHMHNPVDWYPWGPEALERARSDDNPIFLSIGYSACHWCHVMERESFENDEIAAFLNTHFISVKVDREELPDVDEVYMTVVQALTGSGGWPLTVFLTPELEPFFGGTYFPPDDMYGRTGFKKLLAQLSELWRDKRDDVLQSARNITTTIRSHTGEASEESGELGVKILVNAAADLEKTFDPHWGGFGGAPKFPPSSSIAVLLRRFRRSGNEHDLYMATYTLEHMAYGGMYDHLGGGFSRYSVDERWLVPHFEKMLYDNALLSTVYLEALQLTGQPLYARVVRETLDYVGRDMTDTGGGFHAAEDADSEGEEGKFYVWSKVEIEKILGPDDTELFSGCYGVSENGNFEGANILNIRYDARTNAQKHGISEEELLARTDAAREKLFAAREQRIRPGKDNKVIAAWNGLMISSFARASCVLGEERYRNAALTAGQFIRDTMMPDGGLQHVFCNGQCKLPGYLDDYSNVGAAFIDLYEATFDRAWLQLALRTTRTMIDRFWEPSNKSFYFTSAEHTTLFMRTQPTYDGAVPSGNSIAAMNLLRLSRFFDNNDYYDMAEAILRRNLKGMQQTPRGYMNMLLAADYYLHPPVEIAVVGTPDTPGTRAMIDALNSRFLPNRIVAFKAVGAGDDTDPGPEVPLLRDKTAIDDRATAYVCRNFACENPVTTPEALLEQLA